MRGIVFAVVTSLLVALPAQSGCVGLRSPVDGPITGSFAPVGRYSGHWGIDLAVEEKSEVRPAAPGFVSFSGSVAGNETVTIDHGGGLKTSYSYLSERLVARGAWVGLGTRVARTGLAHGSEGLHFSVRIDGLYRDPALVLGCLDLIPADGLRLVR